MNIYKITFTTIDATDYFTSKVTRWAFAAADTISEAVKNIESRFNVSEVLTIESK